MSFYLLNSFNQFFSVDNTFMCSKTQSIKGQTVKILPPILVLQILLPPHHKQLHFVHSLCLVFVILSA